MIKETRQKQKIGQTREKKEVFNDKQNFKKIYIVCFKTLKNKLYRK